ncbi:uncharacterized protein KY384_005391 [Bacidia gigantensis]|uniref:uncharacterized protein n=1 Tax=Bacidia gigantensis TaxID=2732470 RepID=UPI001D043268|nr:uncharacterized protein KY384_005391 [Bacidia gigantensis]KAG8529910.1 hypothetical protein KY384_005391 [Bacidia gigantensis]
MANALSPLTPSRINQNSPFSKDRRKENISPSKPAIAQDENRRFDGENGPPSSPFVEDVSLPPSKFPIASPSKLRSPRKDLESRERRALTEDALRENEGLARHKPDFDVSNIDPSIRRPLEEDAASAIEGASVAGMDDTCFSAFSAVPNADMTRFANIGQSPPKDTHFSPSARLDGEGPTPRPQSRHTPQRRGRLNEDYASPTPRRHQSHYDEDTTNLLVDFNDDYSHTRTPNRSPHKLSRPTALRSSPHKDLSSYASSRRAPSPAKYPLPPNTPCEARNLANLLDFELTPAPTPRSIPSITARELESMKSNFLSQISSLTATLSGREAEVKALSTAVNDAERRVGEALEEVRNERSVKETLEAEKEGFENRQKEMQKVLKDVKEEIVSSDREKDSLLQRAQEAEHQRELAESRAVEAESKLEGMKASSPSTSAAPSESNGSATAEVEAAVTKVARELHGLYKSKHEAKVTALKKSYSDRWEKKVKELQSKVDDLGKENEELRVGRDATMTSVVPGTTITGAAESERQKEEKLMQRKQYDEQKQKLETVERELLQLQKDLTSTRDENGTLRTQLSASRTEIDDLVSATEELMQLSLSGGSESRSYSSDNQQAPLGGTTSQDIKSSLSRSVSGGSSGLKAPGFTAGESRIGKVGGEYGGTFPRERSGSGLKMRSGIMSNIERMGRGRAAE